MMTIDAHHHFWHYNTQDYGWISDEMAVLRRDFLPEDLEQTIRAAHVDKVISVQARQCIEETDWLLGFAKKYSFIGGVTGWLPIQSPDFPSILERYAEIPELKALRHVVQDEPDDDFILRDDFVRGVREIMKTRLLYEILIFERQLPAAIRFVELMPDDRTFVLDHIAKPKIKAGEMEPWRSNLRKLAAHENVVCKLSGMVTEADLKNWTPEQLAPYFEVVLDTFGPKRVMFGSDWPVCTSATTYTDWKHCVEQAIAGLGADEKASIFGGNAATIYGVTES